MKHALQSAAVNKSRRYVQPDYRTLGNCLEIAGQQIRKTFRARKDLAVNISERDEAAAGFQNLHHFIETLHLQRLWKRRPRQSRYDAIHRLDSGATANGLHIDGAFLKQTHTGIARFEYLREARIQLNGGKLCFRFQFAKNELGEDSSAWAVFENGFSLAKSDVLQNRLG